MNKPKPAGRNDGHETDYSKITDNIFVGSNLCKGMVCPIHSHEFEKLEISVEINLMAEKAETPPDMLEGYLWLPVVDGYAPNPIQLDMGTSSMHETIEKGKKVYVHCKNGHGRSPSMVAGYLMRYKNMSFDEANNLIKNARPEIHIESVQIKALEEARVRWSK